MLKKSEVLKEGYIKGLRKALKMIGEAIDVDSLLGKIDDHDKRANDQAVSEYHSRAKNIQDFLEFAKENKERFASLIKLGKRLLKSESLCHLVLCWPARDISGKIGFCADGVNHRLGFYIPEYNNYGNLMIGACGGGADGPIDLAVDENGDVFVFDAESAKNCGLLKDKKEKYKTNERLFNHLSNLMNTIEELDTFESELEKVLS